MMKSFVVHLLFLWQVGGELRNRLYGRHLRTSSATFPPFMYSNLTVNNTLIFYGPLVDHLQWLSERLHFTYNLTASPGDVIGVKENGRWNGMMGQLVRKEIDLAAFCFTVSWQRFQLFHLAGLVTGDNIGLLVQYPKGHVSWTALVQPYTFPVWMGWIVSLFAMAASCYIFVQLRATFINTGHYQRMKTVDDMLVYIFGVITAQGGFYRFGNRFIGILATAWCLASCVFVYVYSCTLVSYLATSYRAPNINSLQQLANNSRYQILTIKGTNSEAGILTATTGAPKVLGDRLRKCPDCRMHSIEDFARRIKQGHCVGMVTSATCSELVMADYEVNKQCHLTLAYERTNWKAMMMGLPKGSPYVEEINRESLWAHAFGLPFKWKSYLPDFGPCKLNYNHNGVEVRSQNRRLELRQFSTGFLLLAVGYGVACVLFVYERIRWRLFYASYNDHKHLPVAMNATWWLKLEPLLLSISSR